MAKGISPKQKRRDEETPILSVTASDCEWEYFRAGGKGGQNANKVSAGVRCKHVPSGAVAEARDTRDQLRNRKSAFRRMCETKEFTTWVRLQAGEDARVIAAVERELWPDRIKIETKNELGEWE